MTDYFQKGIEYYNNNNFYKSLSNFERAYTYYKDLKDYPSMVDTLNWIGMCYTKLELYEKALGVTERALLIGLKNFGEKHIEIARVYDSLGEIYLLKNLYNKSIEYYSKALNLYSILSEATKFDVASMYNQIAYNLKSKKDLYNALEFYFKAEKVIKGGKSFLLGLIYNNIGAASNKILRKYEYNDLGKYNGINPLHYFKKALNVNKDKDTFRADVYNNMAYYYLYASDPKKEIYFLRKSLKHYIDVAGPDSMFTSRSYINMGKYYFRGGLYEKAIRYFKKALAVRLKRVGKYDTRLSPIYRHIGLSYIRQGKYSIGLRNIQKALNIIAGKNEEKSIYKNPFVEKIVSASHLLEILIDKAEALKQLFEKNTLVKPLKASFECYYTASKLLDNIKKTFTYEESKRIFISKAVSIYEDAIEIALELHNITGENKYFGTAFLFVEKCKGILLLEDMQDFEAKQYTNIPKSLLENERRLKTEIAFYDKKILDESRKGSKAGREKISEWEDSVFKFKEEYEALVKNLEKKYPEYYELKYNMDTVSIEEIQKKVVGRDSILLEYFVGDKNIYVFRISHSGVSLFKINKSKNFERRLNEYRRALTDLRFDKLKSNFKKFISNSHYLYKLLVKNFLPEDIGDGIRRLIIIPDGLLGYIPFETLITEKPAENEKNFKNLSYLIEKYSISSGYSSTLLYRDLSKQRLKRDNKVLGFAPSFSTSKAGSRGAVLRSKSRDVLRSQLSPLKWNTREVENTSKYFKGELFKGKDATKENFEKFAGKFSIIHLATHGVTDDRNPLYSKVAFAPGKETMEDGYLHTYELYNIKLNAKLAILSACNTGYGKLVKGEGIMSIARGFAYAGCRSIVMSLWQASDFATSKIMTYFYEGLANGLTKDEALRNAKLMYIKSADELKSSPFFWAPFISIGDMRAIK